MGTLVDRLIVASLLTRGGGDIDVHLDFLDAITDPDGIQMVFLAMLRAVSKCS